MGNIVQNEDGSLEGFPTLCEEGEKPKFISFFAFNRNKNWVYKYIDIDLIPHPDITIDRQMEEGCKNKTIVLYYGVIETTISINWLGFTAGVIFSKLTNKWEKQEWERN